MPVKCFHCQNELDLNPNENISRRESCAICLRDLHCCMMCNFFDPFAYNQCKEPIAERIPDKEKANFCDFFRTKNTIPSDSNSYIDKKKAIWDAANALFKKDN